MYMYFKISKILLSNFWNQLLRIERNENSKQTMAGI